MGRQANVMPTYRTLLQTIALVTLCHGASGSSVLAQALAAGPGPEHTKLEVFVGEWSFEGESKAVPALGMADAGRVSYRHVNRWRMAVFSSRRVELARDPEAP